MTSYINEKAVTIPSRRLVEELRTFIWKHGKAQAQDGYNDDLVMSFSMGMFLRDTSLRYKEQGTQMTMAMINGIGKTQHLTTPSPVGGPSYNHFHNSPSDQWKMDLGNGQSMDLTWLI
jgi:hypothetical protein